MTPSLRDRLVTAAVGLTTTRGWAHVTMAKLAAEVGVSRQTVYNEIGTKSALAEAMVLAELARFLDLVVAAFDEHPDDLPVAIETAIRAVLEHAQDNPLLHAVVSATHGADTELLPLLVTHSSPLLEVSKTLLADRVAAYDPPLSSEQLDAAIDVVVRVVLSHIMQPSGAPAKTAADLAFIAARVLQA